MQRFAERCILFIHDVFRQVTKCTTFTNFSGNVTQKYTLSETSQLEKRAIDKKKIYNNKCNTININFLVLCNKDQFTSYKIKQLV